MNKYYTDFSNSKNMANFRLFCKKISSSINLLFLNSDVLKNELINKVIKHIVCGCTYIKLVFSDQKK